MASSEGYRPLTIAPGPGPEVSAISAAMKPCASLQEYIANPIGRYIVGSTWLVWYKTVGLSGMVFWGRPEPEHIASVIRSIDIDADGRPRASLVDIRRVEFIVPLAFDALAAYVRSHYEKLRVRVSAQALLRQDGLVGTAVAGFYRVLDHPHPVEVFRDPYEALVWLGAVQQQSVILEVDEIVEGARDTPSAVRALRARLAENPARPTSLREEAAFLGLSSRSLQRKLQLVNSSFRAEQNVARVQSAQRLILDTNYDIKRVAFEVGCTSASNFSVLFRKVVGQTPSTWRSRVTSGVSSPGRDLEEVVLPTTDAPSPRTPDP
jgi:AraC-like DNA-binding protein